MKAALLSLLFAATLTGQQVMSIQDYEPKSTLVVPQHPAPRAARVGKLLDEMPNVYTEIAA
jgi:hypothetical protein